MRMVLSCLLVCLTAGRAPGAAALRYGTTDCDPGQTAALPLWVRSASAIHGFSLAFSYDGRGLRVQRFHINEEFVPASEVAYAHVFDAPQQDYALLGTLLVWDTPTLEGGFPPTPSGEERLLGWVIFQTDTGTPPGDYTVLPRNDLGSPVVGNTFSVEGGHSVMPSLSAGTLRVRNHNVLRVRSAYGRAGDTVRVYIEIDHAQPVAGLQVALRYDADRIRLRDADPGAPDPCLQPITYCGLPVEALLAPQRVEQFILRVDNAYGPGTGWAGCGMLFDYLPPYQDHVLPPGTAHRVLAADFILAPTLGEGERIPIDLVDGEGDPPLDNKVLLPRYGSDGRIVDLASVFPRKEHGAITVVGAGVPFRRGYVNGDERFNIADAVALLQFLFADGAPPGCMSAADANDDGRVNIADAIALLTVLFVPGSAPLPPPSSACGVDPTPDALTCEHSTFGCGPDG